MKTKTNQPKPSYNPKFHQYEITWKDIDGGYNGVWGDTEEECLKRYNEAVKKWKQIN